MQNTLFKYLQLVWTVFFVFRLPSAPLPVLVYYHYFCACSSPACGMSLSRFPFPLFLLLCSSVQRSPLKEYFYVHLYSTWCCGCVVHVACGGLTPSCIWCTCQARRKAASVKPRPGRGNEQIHVGYQPT